ncbi:hypothetical protein [Virgibacillus sediminis]|uniref:Uncharacterized protein n=1 Tax=Virgibacillus sediminis TaxID=202260 RepID=A0ABV7A141_9BACI
MIERCQNFLGGSTNFEVALRKGTEVNQSGNFKKADIGNGETPVAEEFLQFLLEQKQVKAFQVLSLLIGTNRKDKTVEIKDFTDEGSFTAFGI